MRHSHPVAPDNQPAPWALMVAFALVYLCWGTTYLALKWGVQDEGLPPLLFGGTRIATAGMLILGWQWLRGQPLSLPAGDRLPVLLCALLLFVGGNGLINVAAASLDSGMSAVLAATVPLWVGLFEMCWPRGDRLSGRGWLGLALGLVGVVLVCMPKFQEVGGPTVKVGIVAVLASGCFWSLGSVVSRHRRMSCSRLTSAGYQMVLGGIGGTLVGLARGEVGQMPDHITAKAVWSFVWLLICGSLTGFIAYNWLLAHVSVAKVGTYAYVNPVIAVLIGILVGESATGWLFAGIVVILIGVALVRGGLVAPVPKVAKALPNTPVKVFEVGVSSSSSLT